MNYEELDEYGQALATAFHATDSEVDQAVLNGLFGVHTNTTVGDAGPPPPPPGH